MPTNLSWNVLFRSPLRSTSLSEFWGQRWNLAFAEMTTLAIYQPLARHAGRRPALAASFLAFGLLHELAISLSVQAGYGLPFTCLTLQGTLVLLESRLKNSGHPVDNNPWIGRFWTFAWIKSHSQQPEPQTNPPILDRIQAQVAPASHCMPESSQTAARPS